MSSSPPRLSLCLVVRDAAPDLRRTLASLEAQRHLLLTLPAEIVVVDGDSADGSGQLAKRWGAHCGVPTTCHQQPPMGIYPAMNLAWQQAAGDWLLFINAGDLLLEASDLPELLDAADREGIDSVQCAAAIFPPGWRWAATSRQQPVSCHQSLLYRRRLHQRLGPYDERLGLCADVLLMGAIEGGHHRRVPLLLAATQVSPRNASRTFRRVRQDLERLQRHQIPLKPWPSPRQTLVVLWLEERLGVSLSVWIRAAVDLLLGSRRLIRLPDAPL